MQEARSAIRSYRDHVARLNQHNENQLVNVVTAYLNLPGQANITELFGPDGETPYSKETARKLIAMSRRSKKDPAVNGAAAMNAFVAGEVKIETGEPGINVAEVKKEVRKLQPGAPYPSRARVGLGRNSGTGPIRGGGQVIAIEPPNRSKSWKVIAGQTLGYTVFAFLVIYVMYYMRFTTAQGQAGTIMSGGLNGKLPMVTVPAMIPQYLNSNQRSWNMKELPDVISDVNALVKERMESYWVTSVRFGQRVIRNPLAYVAPFLKFNWDPLIPPLPDAEKKLMEFVRNESTGLKKCMEYHSQRRGMVRCLDGMDQALTEMIQKSSNILPETGMLLDKFATMMRAVVKMEEMMSGFNVVLYGETLSIEVSNEYKRLAALMDPETFEMGLKALAMVGGASFSSQDLEDTRALFGFLRQFNYFNGNKILFENGTFDMVKAQRCIQDREGACSKLMDIITKPDQGIKIVRVVQK